MVLLQSAKTIRLRHTAARKAEASRALWHITERQFRKIYFEAVRLKGDTGETRSVSNHALIPLFTVRALFHPVCCKADGKLAICALMVKSEYTVTKFLKACG
jgi:hypothetical protein